MNGVLVYRQVLDLQVRIGRQRGRDAQLRRVVALGRAGRVVFKDVVVVVTRDLDVKIADAAQAVGQFEAVAARLGLARCHLGGVEVD